MALDFPLHGFFQLGVGHARHFNDADHDGVLAGDAPNRFLGCNAAALHQMLNGGAHCGGIGDDAVLDNPQRRRAKRERRHDQPGLAGPKLRDLDLLCSNINAN